VNYTPNSEEIWSLLLFKEKYPLILMTSTHLIKVETGPCSPMSIIIFSFLTVCECVETEKYSCWTFGRKDVPFLSDIIF